MSLAKWYYYYHCCCWRRMWRLKNKSSPGSKRIRNRAKFYLSGIRPLFGLFLGNHCISVPFWTRGVLYCGPNYGQRFDSPFWKAKNGECDFDRWCGYDQDAEDDFDWLIQDGRAAVPIGQHDRYQYGRLHSPFIHSKVNHTTVIRGWIEFTEKKWLKIDENTSAAHLYSLF